MSLCLAVHGAALAAAAIFRGQHLPGGFGASATGLAHLPWHLADPAQAWPPAARAALPGPAALWACIGTALSLLSGTVAGGWTAWHRLARKWQPLDQPGAGFARRHDLRRLLVRRPVTGRLTVGRIGRRLVAAEAQASLAVVGPTGCGKTAGFAIPALLEWEGPILATSVKADLLDATVRNRKAKGSVWVYDPTGCSRNADSAGWSPLSSCGTWVGAMRVAAWVCEAARPRLDTVSDGDYWYSQGQKVLAPYLYAAATSGKAMRDVVRWIDAQEQIEVEAALRKVSGIDTALTAAMSSDEAGKRRDRHREQVRKDVITAFRRVLSDRSTGRVSWVNRPVKGWPEDRQAQLDERVDAELEQLVRELFEAELMQQHASEDRFAPLIAARSQWAKDPRLRDSFFSTAQNVLASYADPGVAEAADRKGIDLNEWLGGNNTIYIVATAHEQARLRPVLTVLVQSAIRSAYDTASTSDYGHLPRPCLVLLDEAGNTAPLRDLPGYASTARSHGISLVTIWQDMAQVKALYQDRAYTVINNHRARLFGTGIADHPTLDYVSRLVGDIPHTERNVSADAYGARRTVSEHRSWRRAAPIDVLRRLSPERAVLLYGSELPALIRLRPWFADRHLNRLGDTATKEQR
jgi:type IV secretion system protein VirD4